MEKQVIDMNTGDMKANLVEIINALRAEYQALPEMPIDLLEVSPVIEAQRAAKLEQIEEAADFLQRIRDLEVELHNRLHDIRRKALSEKATK